jgi:transposase
MAPHRTDPGVQAARRPRVDHRRVLKGIFWVLRSGTPWRDLPERYGPYTTRYNLFVRWRMALIPEQGDAIQAGRRRAKQTSLPDI